MLSRLVHYFSLETAVMGGGVKRQLFLYTGVVAGTVAKWLFDFLSGGAFAWQPLVLGLIASVVIYPTIFEKAGLNKSPADFLKWCVAFQNGFFWVALFASIGKTIG